MTETREPNINEVSDTVLRIAAILFEQEAKRIEDFGLTFDASENNVNTCIDSAVRLLSGIATGENNPTLLTKIAASASIISMLKSESVVNGVSSGVFDSSAGFGPGDSALISKAKEVLGIEKNETVANKAIATKTTEGTQTMTNKAAITIDPAMAAPLNSMIEAASGGKIKDILAVVRENEAYKDQLDDTRKEISSLKLKLATKEIPTTGASSADGKSLTYEIVYTKAADMFKNKSGKKAAVLNFDIPTIVWKDSAGNVVRHPECPDIDENYIFTPQQLIKFLTATVQNMNAWLFGHTGTGKSTFVEQVAARTGFPVSRINLDSNLERADLVGHVTLASKDGTTVSEYEEGILPRAMQRPGYLLMDEIDAGRPDILFVVQRALEHKGLMLTEDKGRIIKTHPLFRFVATANTRGQGDEYGMYQGTRVMNASMIDRFTCFIEFDYMSKGDESALLTDTNAGLKTETAEQMVTFAGEVRKAFKKGELYQTISPRGLSSLASTYMHFLTIMPDEKSARKLAVDMCIIDKATNDSRQKIMEIGDRCFS